MSDTRALLDRIGALRQRLEQAQGLLKEDSSAADTATAGTRRPGSDGVPPLPPLLPGRPGGPARAPDPFPALAEIVLAAARQGAPLRFHAPGPVPAAGPADPAAVRAWQVRLVACHGLTVAQV